MICRFTKYSTRRFSTSMTPGESYRKLFQTLQTLDSLTEKTFVDVCHSHFNTMEHVEFDELKYVQWFETLRIKFGRERELRSEDLLETFDSSLAPEAIRNDPVKVLKHLEYLIYQFDADESDKMCK